LNSDDGAGITPEFVELVELPHCGRKYVDDHAAIVAEEPARTGCALQMTIADAFFFKRLLNYVGDSLKLAVTFTGANNKIAGECTYFPDIQQGDVRCQLLTDSFNCFARYINRFQQNAP
jgi:hypothetical protein